MTLRIAIFGTGGAGGFFGARLARAGEDVVFIARGGHLRAIRQEGLHVETPAGEIRIHPAHATDDPAQAGRVDVVLLGVKAWQVTEAAHAMRPMLRAGSFVVPLQNGVEAASQLVTVLGADQVLGGLCGTFSWVARPGRIRNIGGSNFVRFGELDGRRSERAERLRAALERAGVKAEVLTDVRRALWEKFMMITSFGGVGAISRAPIGVIRAQPGTRQVLEQCVREVDAVARAHQVALADSAVADTMAFFDSLAESGTTSLQRDIAEGRPSELEALNGAVVRLAKERGMGAPAHDLIYRSLVPLELRARGRLVFPA